VSMQDTPAIFESTTKTYGTIEALRGLDMTIQRGELLTLLGSNGAGKTTAVRLLLGLGRPTTGQVRLFGGDPRERHNRTRIGAMLQTARVPETLRVAEHIHLFSSYYPDPLPAAEVIHTAGLGGLERRAYGKLSGGQQRRLLLALALIGNPDLLILDEPTVGLDVEARRGLWSQIRRFVESGRSVLLTTHYLAEAEAVADRVVVIDKGVAVASGTPAEIRGDAPSLEDAFMQMVS
jgi:ABC-2 type transport system ATP-binding protein